MIGYRIWVYRETSDGRPELWPIFLVAAGPWAPGVNEAECWRSFEWSTPVCEHIESPPVLECTCGIHLLADLKSAIHLSFESSLNVIANMEIIVGAVQAWGSIIEGAKGVRAQKAQIIALLDNGAVGSMRKLSLIHDVPTLGSISEMQRFAESYESRRDG